MHQYVLSRTSLFTCHQSLSEMSVLKTGWKSMHMTMTATTHWLKPHIHLPSLGHVLKAVFLPVVSHPMFLADVLHSLAGEGCDHATAYTFVYSKHCTTTFMFTRRTYNSLCTGTEKKGRITTHSWNHEFKFSAKLGKNYLAPTSWKIPSSGRCISQIVISTVLPLCYSSENTNVLPD